ncbi:MAG: hypothetical protein L0Z49_09820 [Actinobacteria bacterium]|nr:hypothetical protein [Actinomycetota bacterium]MCI0677419.1 hypothetical protein [Actinomycetota bacterium]
MRHRLAVIAAVALVAAACNPAPETQTTEAPATAAPPEAVLLSYTLEPGTSFQYEVTLDQSFDVDTTGDPSAFGDEEVPGEMSIQMTGVTLFTHTVNEGPTPGTYELTITGDFTDLEFSGTIDGEPVDSAEIPDLGAIEPVDVTVIVDEQGNVVSGEGAGLEDLLGGGALGGLGSLESFGEGMDLGRFVGPPLSDGEVTVGDTWTEEIVVPSFTGEGSMGSTVVESTVTGTDTIDGVEVFVIDTTISVPEIAFDLAEMLLGMFEAFLPEDATDEELAELEMLQDQLRFQFTMDPSVSHSTTWFDHEAGLARRSDYAGDQVLAMDINVPDEETGEMIEFGLSMTVSQSIGYRLVDSASA